MSDKTARTRLLDAASELFCRQGFHAVGVNAIVEAAGTAKATLYKLFGSKEALVEAVLEHEGQEWRDWFLGSLDHGRASARERLERVMPLLIQWFESERFYGCPFINAVGEYDKGDDRIRQLALRHKGAILSRLAALLAEAGAKEPTLLSHQIGLIIDGAIVAALVTGKPDVGRTAALVLNSLLDAHLGRGRKAERKPRRIAA